MRMNTRLKRFNSGFSLVEMAIVMAIIGLLLGGLLPTISSQVEQSRRNEARKQMDEIRSALMGFAISNSRLPCPDTDNDGSENIAAPVTTNNTPSAGQSTKKYSCSASGGTLPYNQLGSASLDSFGSAFVYSVTSTFGEKNEVYSGLDGTGSLLATTYFTLSSVGALRVCASQACATPRLTDTAAAVIVSRGQNWGQTPSTDETENTDNDSDFVSHDFTPTFDDLVTWLSPNTMFDRMVAAGKLP